MRTKILYVIWSLDLGGAEQVVMNLALNLNPEHFEPAVCCLNEKGRFASRLEEKGIRVFELRKKPSFDWQVIGKLVSLIRREKINLVHTHLFTANFWGRIAAGIARVPVISTEHNVDVWKKWPHFAADRILSKFNKKIVFVSHGVEKFYREKLPHLNGKSRILYNGIETKRFEYILGLPVSDLKTVGTAGRLVPQKAQIEFIKAISILIKRGKKIRGLIVGDGPLKVSLEESVQKYGMSEHIVFSGFSSEMENVYRTMDVFVLPSFREGFPMTILEAMAAGVPVVATRIGGVDECIDHGSDGFLIPTRDPHAIAEAVEAILENEHLRNEFVRKAHEKVNSRFSAQTMIHAHEILYDEVLKS